MSKPLIAGLATAATIALFAGPGLIAKAVTERTGNAQVFTVSFDFFTRLIEDLRLADDQKRSRTIASPGGLLSPVECRKVIAGGTGWLCISLTTDGKQFSAAWADREPVRCTQAPARRRSRRVDLPQSLTQLGQAASSPLYPVNRDKPANSVRTRQKTGRGTRGW